MTNTKKTVVLGASTNPSRVSHQAVHRLTSAGFDVVPVGIRKGAIAGIDIQNGSPEIGGVDTVTLYLNPQRQLPYYDYILNKLEPKRIIFNPGTENHELRKLANEKGIETEYACTLVMLSLNIY